MKAKDYYALYVAWSAGGTNNIEATKLLFGKMCHDLSDMMKKRGCKSDSAIEAAVNEYNSIWNAMRKIDPTFRRDGFKEVLIIRAKEMAEEERKKKQTKFDRKFLKFFIFGEKED